MSFLNTEGLKHLSSKIKADLDAKLDSSLKGSANGVAELDSNGKIPSSQLPSIPNIVFGSDNIQDGQPSLYPEGTLYCVIEPVVLNYSEVPEQVIEGSYVITGTDATDVITVSNESDLPTDSPDGTIAIIEEV